MEWLKLTEEGQLSEIKKESSVNTVVIFKHSTRCSISASALSRIERSWNNNEMGNIKPYYLDLIAYRSVSNKLASDFGIEHESPQILVIKNGVCTYDASHIEINYQQLKEAV